MSEITRFDTVQYRHESGSNLRCRLVALTLEWERRYGVAPAFTSAISEYDAAILVGHTPDSYGKVRQDHTAVTANLDFVLDGLRYQVKACRPSGKRGSTVTWVPKARNYMWDRLVWILYDRFYEIVEAWEWPVEQYRTAFHEVARINPEMMRAGYRLAGGTATRSEALNRANPVLPR